MAALPAGRARLAELIEQLRGLERNGAVLAAATPAADAAVRRAREGLAAAHAAVDTAAKRAIDHRISVLAGGSDEPPPAVENARGAVRQAEDDLASAEAARREIEQRTARNTSQTDMLRSNLVIEAKEVLWAEAQPMIAAMVAAAQRAQADYIERAAALQVIHLSAPRPYPDDAVATQLRSVINAIETPPRMWTIGAQSAAAPTAAQQWRAVLEQLMQDPAAKLPR